MKVSVLIGLAAAGLLLIGPLWAEAESPSAAPAPQKSEEASKPGAIEDADTTEYAYGTVKEIAPERMVVGEYDEETGLSTDVSYALDPSVILENVGTLQEITVGDSVDIEYVLSGDGKVAKVVSVEKTLPQETPGKEGASY